MCGIPQPSSASPCAFPKVSKERACGDEFEVSSEPSSLPQPQSFCWVFQIDFACRVSLHSLAYYCSLSPQASGSLCISNSSLRCNSHSKSAASFYRRLAAVSSPKTDSYYSKGLVLVHSKMCTYFLISFWLTLNLVPFSSSMFLISSSHSSSSQ